MLELLRLLRLSVSCDSEELRLGRGVMTFSNCSSREDLLVTVYSSSGYVLNKLEGLPLIIDTSILFIEYITALIHMTVD